MLAAASGARTSAIMRYGSHRPQSFAAMTTAGIWRNT